MGAGPGLAACLMDTWMVLGYQRQIAVSSASEVRMPRKQRLFGKFGWLLRLVGITLQASRFPATASQF